MPSQSKQNRQVLRTQSWIFEALLRLMEGKPYDKISISDIAVTAGIARQTFYRNYNNIEDVVMDYLSKCINIEREDSAKTRKERKDIVLTFDFAYMLNERKNLIKLLAVPEIENRVNQRVQTLPMLLIEQYKSSLTKEEYLICRYKICYQISGCLRVFLDWFKQNMPLPVDTILAILNKMNTPSSRYHAIPNLIVCINQ